MSCTAPLIVEVGYFNGLIWATAETGSTTTSKAIQLGSGNTATLTIAPTSAGEFTVTVSFGTSPATIPPQTNPADSIQYLVVGDTVWVAFITPATSTTYSWTVFSYSAGNTGILAIMNSVALGNTPQPNVWAPASGVMYMLLYETTQPGVLGGFYLTVPNTPLCGLGNLALTSTNFVMRVYATSPDSGSELIVYTADGSSVQLPICNLTLSPSSGLEFGVMLFSTKSEPKSIVLTNTGFGCVQITEFVNAANFGVVSPPLPFYLGAHMSQTLEIVCFAFHMGVLNESIGIVSSPQGGTQAITCTAVVNVVGRPVLKVPPFLGDL